MSSISESEKLRQNQIQRDRDFSDRVQGEDLEFRERNESSFQITHKIELLGKVILPDAFNKLSSHQLITLSGAASGFLAGIVVCPLDVVKTRLQAKGALMNLPKKDIGKQTGLLGEFKDILRSEGIRGLYRGLVPITLGYLPTWTIYFTIYERTKRFYPGFWQRNFGINHDFLNHFCSAMTAGMASSIAVNPIWVVKTRLMIQTGHLKNTPLEGTYYKGTIDAFRTMYREEGLKVFYSGLIPSLFGLLHVGIHFPVYEHLKFLLRVDHVENNNQSSSRLWRLIFASAFSKMIASTITYPHEVLRTRMQIQATKTQLMPSTSKKSHHKLGVNISKIYNKEGIKGFYAGYFINLARTVPASAVTLVSFEYFKTYLLEISGKSLE